MNWVKGSNAANYQGRFFIEVPTHEIIKDFKATDKLNALSSRVINKTSSGVTTWEMLGFSESLKAVLILQEKNYSHKLSGEEGVVFIQIGKNF
jgi:hypothetical protein